jgi:hypothetical protein
MQPVITAATLGVCVTLLVLMAIIGAGRFVGREPTVPWTCDDTRYNDTVPTGRGVVGPSVSAPPGCS